MTTLDLNQYGDACRCLLRLREDQGLPGLSDRSFIDQHLERYPAWKDRPGTTDASELFALARELGLADGFDLSRDYHHVLDEHRRGHSILVATERPPQQSGPPLPYDRYVTVLQQMDEESFALWCPYRSGHSELLPPAAAVWWDRWLCVGIVLRLST